MFPRPSIKFKTLKHSKKKPSHHRAQSTDTFKPTQTHKKKKKLQKPSHKRASSIYYELVPLHGKTVIKAPKIFKNQIFSDIYDEQGNHDRVIEISTDTDHELSFQNQFISQDILQLPTVGRNLYNSKKIIFC
jgi:hypothetical protein